MAVYSDFPKPLLDKLANYFPEADRELFYDRCEKMHEIRVKALKVKQEAEQAAKE